MLTVNIHESGSTGLRQVRYLYSNHVGISCSHMTVGEGFSWLTMFCYAETCDTQLYSNHVGISYSHMTAGEGLSTPSAFLLTLSTIRLHD
jgi:hypothetical protein